MAEIVKLPELQRVRIDAIVSSILPHDRARALRVLHETYPFTPTDDLKGKSSMEVDDMFDAINLRDMKLVAEVLERPDLGTLSHWDAALVLTRLRQDQMEACRKMYP